MPEVSVQFFLDARAVYTSLNEIFYILAWKSLQNTSVLDESGIDGVHSFESFKKRRTHDTSERLLRNEALEIITQSDDNL